MGKPVFSNTEFKVLSTMVDDGTFIVEVPTPKGWKCERKNCHSEVKHTHSIYSSLI